MSTKRKRSETTLRDRLIAELRTRAPISIEIESEVTEIEGNASAIDPDTDRQIYEWIRDQLRSGNDWAWCAVKVSVTLLDLTGEDHLGCCSYESERDFRAGGYFEDMVTCAIASLADQILEMPTKADAIKVRYREILRELGVKP